MNREDVIRMARDSGMELYGLGKDREKFVYYLQEFAALVAAAAVASEREACAKVCEGFDFRFQDDSAGSLQDAAEAIRARGQQ